MPKKKVLGFIVLLGLITIILTILYLANFGRITIFSTLSTSAIQEKDSEPSINIPIVTIFFISIIALAIILEFILQNHKKAHPSARPHNRFIKLKNIN